MDWQLLDYSVRTNGKLLAEGRYDSFLELEEAFLGQEFEADEDEDLLIRQIAMSSRIKGVVNHSRTLSLSVYDSELIFCRIANFKYFYRAKHGLLFVCSQHLQDPLALAITTTEQLINRVIRLYESTCDQLSCPYSFQKFAGNYQQKQFQQIGNKINSILEEEFVFGAKAKNHRSTASYCNSLGPSLEGEKERLLKREEFYEKLSSIFLSSKEEGNSFEKASEEILAKYRMGSIIAILSLVQALLICWYIYQTS